MSDSMRLHGLQHARLPCPSPAPRACSNWCPSSWWCHPPISSLVVPFSSCPQSLPAGGQREEFRPRQRSWGRRLGICKGVIKPQETPCSRESTPKPESVLCSHLHLWLYGGLSPRTVSLGEGVNVQLQDNKNSWAWQECFSLPTPLKVI